MHGKPVDPYKNDIKRIKNRQAIEMRHENTLKIPNNFLSFKVILLFCARIKMVHTNLHIISNTTGFAAANGTTITTSTTTR
jgi:hypothetical protein